jgi:hypothetical protein
VKNRQFATLARHLARELPNFAVKDYLVFQCPIARSLNGLCFESSSHEDRAFYVWYFFMPLCVPSKFLYFNFGERLRLRSGSDRWNADDPRLVSEMSCAIRQQAIPFISGLTLPLEIAKKIERIGKQDTPMTLEAAAYSYILAGEIDRARTVLDRLTVALDPKYTSDVEIRSRSQTIVAKLSSGICDAREQLLSWERETIGYLGLKEFQTTPQP